MTEPDWERALIDLEEGNFSNLENALGGPEGFDQRIVEWHTQGRFDDHPAMLAEALTCACMLGRTRTAEYLIDHGVDPYAGMNTWLAGPHYAVSSGHPDTVRMLIDKGTSLEVKNLHGGTMLGQALWSAVNEHKPTHAAIIEMLILAGAHIEPGTLEWWNEQEIPWPETKSKVANMLRAPSEFHERAATAERRVAEAETSGSKRVLADALKELGNILRRPPFGRNAANAAFERAASLYADLGLPLEESWVRRHIGINHEYAGRLEEAERYYDDALELFRKHAPENSLNYANTVRYPAVIKNRLGKRGESALLWKEALGRYEDVRIPLAVAEAAAWLTIFAIEADDAEQAERSFAKAAAAAEMAADRDTDTFIAEVRQRLSRLRA